MPYKEILVLLACTARIVASSPGYEIRPMPDHPGIFYEELPNIRVTTTDWKIITYLDLEWHLARQPWGIDQIKHILYECKSLLSPSQCRSLLPEARLRNRETRIHGLKAEIQALVSSAEEYQPPRTLKNRGAPLGFIGTISHALFGTLTEDDAERYGEEITKLEKKGQELTHLVKNTTHIIRGAINKIGGEVQLLDFEIRRVANATVDVQQTLRWELEDIHRLNYTTHLISLSANLIDAADNYIETLQRFVDVIRNAHLGILHSDLLSVKQLTTAANHVRESMISLEFPVSITDLRVADLSSLSRITTRYQDGRLLVSITLPLLDSKPFQLYRMYPCLRAQTFNGTTRGTAYVQPKQPYLAWSNEQGKYFTFDESYLKKCYHLPNSYACPLHAALRDVHDNDACEARLLVSPTSDTLRKCDIRMARNHRGQWTFLEHTHGWLYSLETSETLRIQCRDSTSTTVVLEGTGIIQLNPGCTGYASHITLPPTSAIPSSIDRVHQPIAVLNISELSFPIAETYRKDLDPLVLAARVPSLGGQLHQADMSLDTLETHLDQLAEDQKAVRWYHHTGTWAYGGLGLSLATIMGFILYAMRGSFPAMILGCCQRRRPRYRESFIKGDAGNHHISLPLEICGTPQLAIEPTRIAPALPAQPPQISAPTVTLVT